VVGFADFLPGPRSAVTQQGHSHAARLLLLAKPTRAPILLSLPAQSHRGTLVRSKEEHTGTLSSTPFLLADILSLYHGIYRNNSADVFLPDR